ncbi:MAG: HNH endonuclease [Dehalococcoidales bacterium]|nr:HNH endonuclease [Dehalococcoidales bacterium]
MLTNLPVLVLNQSYEPLHVCRVRRAIVLMYENKAEMLENGSGHLHTANLDIPVPSVIRLAIMVRRPHRKDRKMTRFEIFKRDRYKCQYCGKESKQLTLDHVMPRFRGGEHTWENVVSACVHCNRIKAGRTPHEARMKLLSQPGPPKHNGLFYIPAYQQVRTEWQKYLLQ